MLSVGSARYLVRDFRLTEKCRRVALDSTSYSPFLRRIIALPFALSYFRAYLELPEEVSSQCFSARVIGSKIARYETMKRISRSPKPSHHTRRAARDTRADVRNGGTS